MKLLPIFVLCLSSCTSTFYVVRHAEKANQPVNAPPLTPLGMKRAEALANSLQSEKFTDIYSTNTLRTRSTAEPLAKQQQQPIQIYSASPADSMRVFIERLKKLRNKTILVVGHSNTVRYVINGLYEKDTLKQHLEDTEYDNLFVIHRRTGLLRKTHYERRKFNP